MLSRSGMGFGSMGLSWLLGETGLAIDSAHAEGSYSTLTLLMSKHYFCSI